MNLQDFINEIDDEIVGSFKINDNLEPNFWPLDGKQDPWPIIIGLSIRILTFI